MLHLYKLRPLLRHTPPIYKIPAVRLASTDISKYSEDEIRSARKWIADLPAEWIPEEQCDISYSRSSGPGGQNVNKTNSKATLRLPLKKVLPLVPNVFHDELRKSRYYAANSDALVLQSDEDRKQAANLNKCFRKLNDMMRETAANALPGETSASQKKRVEGLQAKENAARLKMKKLRSNKKSSRKSSGYD